MTGGWVFDDYPNIVDNAAIRITRGHSTLVAWVNSALSSPSSFLHRPLASLTFSVNWYFGNGDPWPFKVTNIAIHLINGVLVFCMLRTLLRLVGWRADGLLASPSGRGGAKRTRAEHDTEGAGEGSVSADVPDRTPTPLPNGEGLTTGIDEAAATRLALIVSAAWMLLPINLMAVLYVVQRMESLCQVFVLAGLWAYLHGRWMMLSASDTSRERRGLSLAATGIVMGTVLGLTSKETAVLLPVFAFLAEWIVLKFSRAVSGDNGIRRASHTRLVIPGRPAEPAPDLIRGSNPESVLLTPAATRPAAEAGEPPEGQKTDSGSPLRGVRNDNG